MAGFLRQPGDGLGQFRAVDRVDRLKQIKSLTRLVGLKRADKVQVDPGKALAKTGPFAGRLLHAVFAECAVALFKHRFDARVGLYLGHRDQGHAAGCTPGLCLGFLHALFDLAQAHGSFPFRSGGVLPMPQPPDRAQVHAGLSNALPLWPSLDSREEKQCRTVP